MQVITRFEGYMARSETPHHMRMALTIRSITHSGLSTSGWILTQLSSAIPKFDPPQIKTVTGSVYGGYCGNSTAVASIGYVLPARKLVTEPGMLGNT